MIDEVEAELVVVVMVGDEVAGEAETVGMPLVLVTAEVVGKAVGVVAVGVEAEVEEVARCPGLACVLGAREKLDGYGEVKKKIWVICVQYLASRSCPPPLLCRLA